MKFVLFSNYYPLQIIFAKLDFCKQIKKKKRTKEETKLNLKILSKQQKHSLNLFSGVFALRKLNSNLN